MELKGQHALITGGTRGIGKAIAVGFLKAGAEVLIAARNKKELDDIQKELGSDGIFTFAGDVSSPAEIKKLMEAVRKQWRDDLDIVVNAAGIYGPKGFLEETDEKEWLKTILINLYGTMLVTQAAIPLMKKRKKGVIINFSGGGEGAFPRFSAYAAAKGGVVRFTESIAEELKPWGIRINAIAPGAVNTTLLEEVLKAGPEKVGTEFYEKSRKQKEEGGVSPEKAAELCVFLASKKSQGITGKTLSVVWDNWERIPEHINEVANSDIYTYRRIKPKDRGYNWQ